MIGEKIAALFPRVQWTGGSDIHRSLVLVFEMQNLHDAGDVLKAAYHAKLGAMVWEFYHEKFGKLQWELPQEEFEALIFTDLYRHLHGDGDTQNPKKLKNPVTGNVFHRVAKLQDIAGGVRLWLADDKICLRFRLAEAGDDHEQEVKKTRVKSINALAEQQKIKDEFKINEPSEAESEHASHRVRIRE